MEDTAFPEPDVDHDADAYRRRIRIVTVARGCVVSALEDDFHHFVVTLEHDEAVVTACRAEAHRWPWSTCPDAGAVLAELVGMPLAPRFTAVASVTDPRRNCTHQLDAATLAITHATSGRSRRQYDAEIPVPDAEGRACHRLWVDGTLDLAWTLRAGDGPVDLRAPFSAAPWKGGFMRWADATLEPDAAERAIVLRRASDIGMGRNMQSVLDGYTTAEALAPIMAGVCFTMQPSEMPIALRKRGDALDFAAHPDRLLASGPS